jgi:hypothetical protein
MIAAHDRRPSTIGQRGHSSASFGKLRTSAGIQTAGKRFHTMVLTQCIRNSLWKQYWLSPE